MPKPPRPGSRASRANSSSRPPKQRWSAEQRAATGRKPRRGGSDDRYSSERSGSDRPARGYDRDDARTSGYRGTSSWRPDAATGQRFERPNPYERDERSSRYERDERPQRGYDRNRDDDRAWRSGDRRDDRGSWGNRGGRSERGYERQGGDRYGNDRRFGGDRPNKQRATQFEDSGRPAREWAPRRDDDRGPRRAWDRSERPRDDRGFRDDRSSRDSRSSRDDRSYGRTERPSYARGERPAASRPVIDSRTKRDDWRRPERDRRRDSGFGDRERRQQAHELEHSESELAADTMDWQATEIGDLDLSSVSDQAAFAQLGVPAVLVAALDKKGITEPFPIQRATIPDAIAGRDVLGRGQTGSGKTLGFGLPLLTRLKDADPTGGAPRAIVLVPTRELALQVADVLSPLARSLDLDLILVAGGMSYGPQLRAFERGVDIVVATPGRLIDLMDQGAADLSQVLVTVLDEADHMADLGFLPEVRQILDAVPADGQRLLFSATLDHAVDRVVREYLHNPTTHEVDDNKATITTMEHVMLLVQPSDKDGVTAAIANREGRTVVFVRTQLGANRVAEQLRRAGVMAGALHGGLTQGARSRILQAFRDGTVPVLVATDVAARGIHVDDVSLVLQVDPPMNAKDYLHRAGRTARAGDRGVVVTLSLPHQRRSVSRLLGAAGAKHQPILVKPDDEQLAELTDARPATGEPISDAAYEALIAPKQPVRSARPARRGGPRRDGGRQGGFGGRREGGRSGGGFRRSGNR